MGAHAGDICGDTLAPKSISHQPSRHNKQAGKDKIDKIEGFEEGLAF